MNVTLLRLLFTCALLISLTLLPSNDVTRAEANYHHLKGYPDGYVNVNVLNVRSGPGLGYGIVGYGEWSESVYVSRQALHCSWLEVSMPDGTMGWVYAPLIKLYRSCSHFSVAHVHAIPTATPVPTATPHYQSGGQIYQGADGSHHYDPGYSYGHHYSPPVQHKPYHQPHYQPYHQPHQQHHYDPYAHKPHAHPGTGGPVAPSMDGRHLSVNLGGPFGSPLGGLQTFSWQPAFTLGHGEAFELIYYKVGQDPMRDGFSPAEATGATSLLVDLDESIRRIPQLQSGFDYVWSVLLVKTNPYQRVAALSSGHQFRLEPIFPIKDRDSGGSSSNSGGSNGGNPGNGGAVVTPPIPNTPVPAATNTPAPTSTPGNTPIVLGTFTPTSTPTSILPPQNP